VLGAQLEEFGIVPLTDGIHENSSLDALVVVYKEDQRRRSWHGRSFKVAGLLAAKKAQHRYPTHHASHA